MNSVRWTLLALTLTIASTVHAADDPASRFEMFLSSVPTAPDSAFDDMFAGSGMAEFKPGDFAAMKAQFKALLPLLGKPLGVEKVSEKDIAPSLKKLVYIEKFEKVVVVWIGYYYRPRDNWVANGVFFSSEYAKLFNSYQ